MLRFYFLQKNPLAIATASGPPIRVARAFSCQRRRALALLVDSSSKLGKAFARATGGAELSPELLTILTDVPVGGKRRSTAVNMAKEVGGTGVNRARAADDFATIRARMEELRREREGTKPSEKEGQRDPPMPRGGAIRWPPSEVGEGPGRVRQS